MPDMVASFLEGVATPGLLIISYPCSLQKINKCQKKKIKPAIVTDPHSSPYYIFKIKFNLRR